MTALIARPTVSAVSAVDHGKASFVVASVDLWLSALGALTVSALWIGALADPDYFLVLAIVTVCGVWPAAMLSAASAVVALHSRWRRRAVPFGLSLAALACHVPLVAALIAVNPFGRL